MSVSAPNEGPTTVEYKFQAALNVIQNLPKNGSYKPTPQMMLKFYSYYKQATEGPCRKPKPWAWDVINKAKWESWSKLGDMPKEKAMEEYVESLKRVMAEAPPVSDEQIIEAMPATDNAQEFVKVLGNFYEAVDLEAPSQFKKFSRAQTSCSVTTSTPLRNGTLHDAIDDGSQMDPDNNLSLEEQDHSSEDEPADKGSEDHLADSSNESDDEFCDTAEDLRVTASGIRSYTVVGSVGKTDESDLSQSQSTPRSGNEADNNGTSQGRSSRQTSQAMSSSLGTTRQSASGGSGHKPPHSNTQVKNQIAASMAQLRKDMDSVLNRLSLLESLATRMDGHRTSVNDRNNYALPGIWPFTELSPKTLFFILSWPFVVAWFLNALHRRRLKR